jgi:hypothetical protein
MGNSTEWPVIVTWLMDADIVVDERVALPDISNSVYILENRGEQQKPVA